MLMSVYDPYQTPTRGEPAMVARPNDFITVKPFTEVKARVFGCVYIPSVQPGHTRSVPQGVEPASPDGRVRPAKNDEMPVEIGSATVKSAPQSEAESVPTLEPVSPF